MVWRERTEKVAHVRAIGAMIGQIFNLNHDRVFGRIYAEYAQEVLQETYDARKIKRRLEEVQKELVTVRKMRQQDLSSIDRLNKMQEFYDKTLGDDLMPVTKEPKKRAEPEKVPKPSDRGPSRRR